MIAVDLGIIDYGAALNIQYAAHVLRVGTWKEDILFVMEHQPVLTVGKSGQNSDLLVSECELNKKGIPLYRLNRGGKITCHYPGQLVAYTVMGMDRFQDDIHRFVFFLEEAIIRTLSDFRVEGGRIPEHRGVFVGSDKIASIGIEVRNRVTMHGISLNVHEDSGLYNLFVPCGIRDKGITFLENVCHPRIRVAMKTVKTLFMHHFADVLQESPPVLLDRCMFEQRYMRTGITGISEASAT